MNPKAHNLPGSIGIFELIALLRNLVAAVGLLSVARLVVEKSMIMIMPHRTLYSQWKYENTDDFSDVRELLKLQRQQGQIAAISVAHANAEDDRPEKGKEERGQV